MPWATHAMALAREGWLSKNHAGAPWVAGHQRRWFATSGFHVFYYATPEKRSLKGHFDLRNVVSIRQASDPNAGDDAVELAIALSRADKVDKVMIIAFEGAPDERAGWIIGENCS